MRSLLVRWLRRLLALTLLMVLSAAGVGWWQRESVLAWYAVRGLTRAGEDDCAAWSERIAKHERAALPFLVSQLRRDDPILCGKVRACLLHLSKAWPAADPRGTDLAQLLARDFGAFSGEGCKAALEVEQSLYPSVPADALASILTQAAKLRDSEVRACALGLAFHLRQQPEVGPGCRELVRACLHDASPENRQRALQLAMQPQIDIADRVVPLLRDPAPEIRRSAMIVLGPATDVIATDDLLPWLHDSDAEVRRLCELALKGRGLRTEHLKMGRLMTDARIAERLKVLDALRSNTELEPGIWLRRLSHDPALAVRAATMRMAAEPPFIDLLADRLEQMCQDDPSPTIRQLAQYYLSCRKPSELTAAQ